MPIDTKFALTNMHFICGCADRNSLETRYFYAERHSNHLMPDSRIFTNIYWHFFKHGS